MRAMQHSQRRPPPSQRLVYRDPLPLGNRSRTFIQPLQTCWICAGQQVTCLNALHPSRRHPRAPRAYRRLDASWCTQLRNSKDGWEEKRKEDSTLRISILTFGMVSRDERPSTFHSDILFSGAVGAGHNGLELAGRLKSPGTFSLLDWEVSLSILFVHMHIPKTPQITGVFVTSPFLCTIPQDDHPPYIHSEH
jgi:hypothetical protein